VVGPSGSEGEASVGDFGRDARDPVRDFVVFKYLILPLFVGREKKREGRGCGPVRRRYILILTRRTRVDNPARTSCTGGHRGQIMRMIKMLTGG
jgi:ATP-dependent Lon protease